MGLVDRAHRPAGQGDRPASIAGAHAHPGHCGASHSPGYIALWPGADRRRSVIGDAGLIAHVVDLVNSLPLNQHYSCVSLELEEELWVEVVFRSGRTGHPIAQIQQGLRAGGTCPPMGLLLRGRRERPLDEGRLVLRALHRSIERLR